MSEKKVRLRTYRSDNSKMMAWKEAHEEILQTHRIPYESILDPESPICWTLSVSRENLERALQVISTVRKLDTGYPGRRAV